jgi:DNA-binding beta-propeller fold protein YncE
MLAAGCSAAGTNVQPFAQRSAVVRHSQVADMFVIAWARSQVIGYAGAGTRPVITLQGPKDPQGVAFDAHGNVYVTDATAANIAIFAPGSSTSFATITEPSGDQPYHVAVDSAGDVWVGNETTASGSGDLREFDGKGKLLRSVVCSGLSDYSGAIAVDAAGDLFAQSGLRQTEIVEEIPVGTSGCKPLPPKFASPGGLAVSASGNLVVGDRRMWDAFAYAAPAFKKIVARTNLGGGDPHGASFSAALALTKDNSTIWIANNPAADETVAAAAYRYPHGGRYARARIRIRGGAVDVAVNY